MAYLKQIVISKIPTVRRNKYEVKYGTGKGRKA